MRKYQVWVNESKGFRIVFIAATQDRAEEFIESDCKLFETWLTYTEADAPHFYKRV